MDRGTATGGVGGHAQCQRVCWGSPEGLLGLEGAGLHRGAVQGPRLVGPPVGELAGLAVPACAPAES